METHREWETMGAKWTENGKKERRTRPLISSRMAVLCHLSQSYGIDIKKICYFVIRNSLAAHFRTVKLSLSMRCITWFTNSLRIILSGWTGMGARSDEMCNASVNIKSKLQPIHGQHASVHSFNKTFSSLNRNDIAKWSAASFWVGKTNTEQFPS